MSTVYYMAKEDLPLSKYESMIEFQKYQGVTKLQELNMAQRANYESKTAAEGFLTSFCESIRDDLHE